MIKSNVNISKAIYWSLRGVTIFIALILFCIVALHLIFGYLNFVEYKMTFFQDRVAGCIWISIVIFTILIPHSWTLKSPYFDIRTIMIMLLITMHVYVRLIAQYFELQGDFYILNHPLYFISMLILWITMLMKRKDFSGKFNLLHKQNSYAIL